MTRKTILCTLAGLFLLCASAGAATISVVQGGLGPGTSAQCPAGCKLDVNFAGNDNDVVAWVSTTHANAERTYRFSFWINPNNLPMPSGASIRVFEVRKGKPGAEVLILGGLFFRNGVHKLRLNSFNEDGSAAGAGFDLAANKKTTIEIEWTASSAMGMNDGLIRATKGGTNVKSANHDKFLSGTDGVDETRFGFVKRGDPTIVGSYFLDDFASFRTLAP